MKIRFGLLVIVLVLLGCGETVSPSRAKKAAEDSGFTNVIVQKQHGIAPAFYGCDDKDAVAFDVSAKNPKRDQVNITVCCGLILKGCTIRH